MILPKDRLDINFFHTGNKKFPDCTSFDGRLRIEIYRVFPIKRMELKFVPNPCQ